MSTPDRIELSATDAQSRLTGATIAAIELVPPVEGEDIGHVAIRFDNGLTLYADDPTVLRVGDIVKAAILTCAALAATLWALGGAQTGPTHT